ncbi:MAG TPA: hypothetical protein VIS74_05115 [Chthoniobacterales bacterium]
MVKTQVQIPDRLYLEAKRIATECEMSFAEVVRRGLEKMTEEYPAGRMDPREWQLPPGKDMGDALIPEEEWDTAGHE